MTITAPEKIEDQEQADRDKIYYEGQIQDTAFIQVYLNNLWSTAKFPAIEFQLRSFRTDKRQNRNSLYYQDQPIFSWLKEPLGLTDPIPGIARRKGLLLGVY